MRPRDGAASTPRLGGARDNESISPTAREARAGRSSRHRSRCSGGRRPIFGRPRGGRAAAVRLESCATRPVSSGLCALAGRAAAVRRLLKRPPAAPAAARTGRTGAAAPAAPAASWAPAARWRCAGWSCSAAAQYTPSMVPLGASTDQALPAVIRVHDTDRAASERLSTAPAASITRTPHWASLWEKPRGGKAV